LADLKQYPDKALKKTRSVDTIGSQTNNYNADLDLIDDMDVDFLYKESKLGKKLSEENRFVDVDTKLLESWSKQSTPVI